MFYCGEATVVSKHQSTAPHAFAYETAGLDDLATMSYLNECNVGTFVDLVIHATQVEARLSNEQTIDEQPFLLVHGYDMETVPTGALRFWRCECFAFNVTAKVFSWLHILLVGPAHDLMGIHPIVRIRDEKRHVKIALGDKQMRTLFSK